MTFARNSNYFEPDKPAIDEVIVRIVPDDAVRKTMMINGDADLNMWATKLCEAAGCRKREVSISPNSAWVMRLFPNQAAKGTTDSAASPTQS
jgi:ABC-type transport system substrate-binding protein